MSRIPGSVLVLNNGQKIVFLEDYDVTVNLTSDLSDIKYNYFIILSYYT